MEQIFKNYRQQLNLVELHENLKNYIEQAHQLYNESYLEQIFSMIDLTFLNITDFYQGIAKVTRQVNHIQPVFNIKNVAAIMVYPRFIPAVVNNLTDETVKPAAVVGNFPSSQTFLEVKKLETKMAIDAGAKEVDMVISVGEFLDQRYELVFKEIQELKQIAKDVILKVILETGTLQDAELIYKASILAMEAGADFIKTSTGKEKIGATHDAIYIMSLAAKDFYDRTNKKVGIKPAGGVSSALKAFEFMTIVKNILGEEWINPELFRIGSSSLANKILFELKLTDKNFFSLKPTDY